MVSRYGRARRSAGVNRRPPARNRRNSSRLDVSSGPGAHQIVEVFLGDVVVIPVEPAARDPCPFGEVV